MTCIAIDACRVLAMTINTEGHVVQCEGRCNLFHRSNVAVAGFTVDSLCNVGVMIEENKISDTVHFHPLDRLLLLPYLPDLDHLRLGCGNELVTPHAHLDGGESSARAASYAAVTVLTCDLVVPGVDGVTEGDGLARPGLLAPASRDDKHKEKPGEEGEWHPRGSHGRFDLLRVVRSVALHG